MAKARQRDGVYQRKDRPGWWASYKDADGIRRREKVVAHTRTQAIERLGEMKAAAVKKRAEEKIAGVKYESTITVVELFKKYKRHQKGQLKPTTYERLDCILRNLIARLPERAKDISALVVADFVAERSGEVAAGTVQKEATVLKHALKLGVEWGLLHQNRAQGAKLPKSKQGRLRWLTPTELKAALEAAPEWMRAPLALAVFTGMRRGEILGLRWKDVDLPGRRLYLRDTKNGELRIITVNNLAAAVILGLPQGSPADLLLPDVNPQKLSVYSKRVFESVGIEGASFHTTRHTHASLLAQEGVNIYTIGQMLGHKTARMTQRYAHLSPEYLAESVGKLDKVFAGVHLENKGHDPQKCLAEDTTASPLRSGEIPTTPKSL